MPAGILFWVLMVLWLLLGIIGPRTELGQKYGAFGGTLLEFILFLLLGWRLFGPPLQ